MEDIKKLNLWQKINELRDRLVKLGLKKTGYNKFGGWYYFELDDFLPTVIVLEKEIGLNSNYDGFNEHGELEVVNCDNPAEKRIYKINIKEANMKGSLEIQKAGAENTYGKRYAYGNYLNLIEKDIIDGLDQEEVKEDKKPKAKPTTATKPQPEQPPFMNWKDDAERIAALEEITALLGGDQAKVGQWLNYHHCNHTTITPAIANAIIENIKLKQAKEKAKNG